jgi:hypothetical protein
MISRDLAQTRAPKSDEQKKLQEVQAGRNEKTEAFLKERSRQVANVIS